MRDTYTRVCVTRVRMRVCARTCTREINKWVRASIKDLSYLIILSYLIYAIKPYKLLRAGLFLFHYVLGDVAQCEMSDRAIKSHTSDVTYFQGIPSTKSMEISVQGCSGIRRGV